MYPNAGHVERDLNSIEDAPEADIILSPGTGLILTSLQKIKQKALPGQGFQLTGIRERITRLAMRYELIVVLVGDAINDAIDLDQSDCDAAADFVSFCSSCKTEVQVNYIPSGDESMAAWIAGSIHTYGDAEQEMSLLQDETMVRYCTDILFETSLSIS
jgi:hypothetical protein